MAKRIFQRDAGGVPRLVYMSNWIFSITAGQSVFGSTSTTGYLSPAAGGLGSGSNLSLGGLSLNVLYDGTETDGTQSAVFSVSGFADPGPGPNWITSIVANGKTHLPSESDFSYSYNGGTATWTWSVFGSQAAWFGFKNGGTYNVTVNFS